MDDKQYDVSVVAKRLKELRQSKGKAGKPLSHEKLKAAIAANGYDKISVASLKAYEVAETNNSHANAVSGMRIETLFALATFYGVSADYILGLTEYKTPDTNVAAASQYTGLSEQSINYLCQNVAWSIADEAQTIDFLIKDSAQRPRGHEHRSILGMLHFFLDYRGGHENKYVRTDGIISDSSAGLYDIELSKRIVENAILAEMQQALISLKEKEGK